MRPGLLLVLAAAVVLPSMLPAQQLEPRSYSPSPVGANFAAVGYGYSTGGVLFDPSIPVTNAHADINATSLGYGRTFGFLGKQGLITIGIPYAWGILTGEVGPTLKDSMVRRSGLGDLQTKLSLNIIGSPALSPQAFAKTPPKPFIFGASLLVVAPTGQYYPTKVINISTDRWAFKPELGASYIVDRKLYLDLFYGVWFFGDNTQFYPGSNVQSEAPLSSMQFHVSYTFNTRFWVAADATWYSGGATSTNGGPQVARQDNTRAGLLAAFKITPSQSIKATFSKGATARVGQNFDSYGLGYQYLWF
jgi:hypothetical protein